MKSILFLCTGNSCRSQMAHGFANKLLSHHFTSYSAGVESHGLNSSAVQVMKEVGVDISKHRSQTLDEFGEQTFDYVVTVCEHAAMHCPSMPENTRVIIRRFDDPPKLAKGAKTEEEALGYYRRVRDEIRHWISALPTQLKKEGLC